MIAAKPGEKIRNIAHYEFLSYAVNHGLLTAKERKCIQRGKSNRNNIADLLVNQWNEILTAHPDKANMFYPLSPKVRSNTAGRNPYY